MEKMIAQGNRLIFATSFGYLEPVERVAKRHPEVVFMQSWRPSTLKNIGSYSTYEYEPLYVTGVVAGRLTKTNKIGFVAGHPISQILQNLNAFALGVRSVNPKATVQIVWTNSWWDPPVEAEAAKGLTDSGVDIVGSTGTSATTVAKAAAKNHALAIDTETDMNAVLPEQWLTGSHWNWGPMYYRIAKSVQDGTWKHENLALGLKDGAVELSAFGQVVPGPLKSEARAIAQQIKQGKLIIFKGPLKDREGKIRLSAGQVADQKWLDSIDFFVEGIHGALPKKDH
jgi:basic membrane protein A